MALQLRETFLQGIGQLRFEPTAKRVRAVIGGDAVIDSTRAALVWEPGRMVPVYAVSADDISASLEPDGPAVNPTPADSGQLRGPEDFGSHTTAGQPLLLRPDGERQVLAFRPEDPALERRVLLDFRGFDQWLEEDDPIAGHPRDPYHRIDVRRSSRRVQVAVDGERVADSAHPRLLFETMLPVTRSYLPREDVRTDLLRPSATSSICAYKGVATYWSLQLPDRLVADVVWSYQQPTSEAADIAGLMCFFDERVDVVVDGVPQERPVTPWSPPER